MYKSALVLFLGIFLFFSCRTAYVPNTINVPLFDDAGQYRLSGDIHGNFQFAASPGRNFGIMANAMFRKDGVKTDDLFGKGSLLEAGLGGFKASGPLRWETFVGAGFGMTETRDLGKKFEAKGARFFFQPSVGFHHDIFEIAFTPRLVAGKFQKPETDYSTQELIEHKLYEIDEPFWFFAEPAITGRIGYKWIKLQVQLGRSFKFNDKPLSFEKEINSIGLIFDFGRR